MKDEHLKKSLDGLRWDDDKGDKLLDKVAGILEGSKDHKSPAPKSVPKALGMTPYEFMTEPMESFVKLCEETNYRRITSSLNYIVNFSGKGVTEVVERVAEVRTALREWKTGQTQPPPETTSQEGS